MRGPGQGLSESVYEARAMWPLRAGAGNLRVEAGEAEGTVLGWSSDSVLGVQILYYGKRGVFEGE